MKYKIAFVCTGNSCRSQMAEGWGKELGSDIFEVYSAGTHPAEEVNKNAIDVMKEVGIDISKNKPKLLDDIPFEIDILVKMGCGVVCPFISNQYEEDWGLEDPVGKPIEEFRKTRNIIKEKMMLLIEKTVRGQMAELGVCKSIDEIRDNIDRIDNEIIKFIAERSTYVKQASKFKKDKQDVKSPKRVEQVIEKVRLLAARYNVDANIIEKVYREMINNFINMEMNDYNNQK